QRRASSEFWVKDGCDSIGDALPVFFSWPIFLLDLDAVRPASSQPVDDVLLVVAAEMVVGLRYVHGKIQADDVFDGALELLLQGVGSTPADEDVIWNVAVVEPMEGHGVAKAPRDDRVEKGKARLADVGRCDVPMGKGASRVPA